VATTVPVLAFAVNEKTVDECNSKYVDQMTSDLDALEALVPNVPPEEANYLEKEYSAAILSEPGKRVYQIEHRTLFAAWNLHNAFNDVREHPVNAATD
jgi:hypothetical protein